MTKETKEQKQAELDYDYAVGIVLRNGETGTVNAGVVAQAAATLALAMATQRLAVDRTSRPTTQTP